MLVSASEMRFDFKGARFDLDRAEERRLLAWIFSQFLYGEVTGIQCGHWLYRAPHFAAATFLAKQAGEELSHVRKFLRIFSLLNETPSAAHPAVKFLSTGMMGGCWGEHVALEMALGEGLVLSAFYALVETIPDPEIHRILSSATAEEERHVEFGERETLAWVDAHPRTRGPILGQALVQLWALRRLKKFVSRRLLRGELAKHPVLGQFDSFFEHCVRCFESRIERLGLSPRPVREISLIGRFGLLSGLPFWKMSGWLRVRKPLLTSTYLSDPSLREEQERFRSSR